MQPEWKGTEPHSGCACPPPQSSPAAAPQEEPPKTKRCGFSPRLKSAASVTTPHLRAIAFLQINRQ